jgi:hypothetical protein
MYNFVLIDFRNTIWTIFWLLDCFSIKCLYPGSHTSSCRFFCWCSSSTPGYGLGIYTAGLENVRASGSSAHKLIRVGHLQHGMSLADGCVLLCYEIWKDPSEGIGSSALSFCSTFVPWCTSHFAVFSTRHNVQLLPAREYGLPDHNFAPPDLRLFLPVPRLLWLLLLWS